MLEHKFKDILFADDVDSVFFSLSKPEKSLIIKNAKYAYLGKGELVFAEKEVPTELIILLDGKVKISKSGAGSRDQIIKLSRAGDLLGYRALFAEQKYQASATALSAAAICTVQRSVISSLAHKNAAFVTDLLKYMAKDLGCANMRTISLTQKHVRGRVAESLLLLIKTYGFADDGQTMSAVFSRQDIASLSNMTTSNAIRTLSAFASEGLIKLDGKAIVVTDLDKLKYISDLG